MKNYNKKFELILNKETKMTSLDLVDVVNSYRKELENKSYLAHADLLKIIRYEFEEEINQGKISVVEYKDKKGEMRPMFELTYTQSKQILLRESKHVRKAVIQYIEILEHELTEAKNLAKQNIESRNLARHFYRPMTDALKDYLIENGIEPKGYHYAKEADVLNVLVFGQTSKEWKDENPNEASIGNQRDFAMLDEKILISKLEELNRAYLETGIDDDIREGMLKQYLKKRLKINNR